MSSSSGGGAVDADAGDVLRHRQATMPDVAYRGSAGMAAAASAASCVGQHHGAHVSVVVAACYASCRGRFAATQAAEGVARTAALGLQGHRR